MKIRIICLLMTVFMLFLALPSFAQGKYSTYRDYFPLADIPTESWYTPAVEFCYVNTYMRGVSDTSFEPSSIATREQMVMIMANMMHEDTSEFTESSFIDIEEGMWYTGAIAWAQSIGLTNGIGDERFGLGLNITREEAVTMFYSYVKIAASGSSAVGELEGFTDAENVSDWALEAIQWAVGAGVIRGNDLNMLDPKGILTRAQAAQLIYNLQLNCLHTYHEHEFSEATCTEPARCTAMVDDYDCKLLLAPAKGHCYDTLENCESYVTCNDCGELLYTPKGHDYKAATCTSPMICTKCNKTEGEALGHTVDIGVCGRCNEELFADEYEKLTYYLKSKGEYRGNTKQLHIRINYNNSDYAEQYAGYDYSDEKCYIRLIYRFAKKGDTIDLKMKFDSISQSYTYTVAYSSGGEVKYSGVGSVKASEFTKSSALTLTEYSGDEGYRQALEKLCAPTLRLTLDGANYLLTKEIGMGVKTLGFVNF